MLASVVVVGRVSAAEGSGSVPRAPFGWKTIGTRRRGR